MPPVKHDPEKWEPVFGKDHAQTKHDPEKWEPVFGKDHAQTKHDPEKGEPVFGKDHAQTTRPPLAVLFACGLNSVRSPIAAALFGQIFGRGVYVGSAGVRKGELDPFAVTVMNEIGLDISRHKPLTFEELDEWEGLNFDLIISLAPEAHHRALELTRTSAVDVEYWPTADPTAVEGSREQRLEAYRQVRDQILARIRQRFIPRGPGNE